jgi:hypothetical protein
MNRRTILFLGLAAGLRADSADQVWDRLASMASALSDGDAPGFMAAIDPRMPGYQALRANVIAITRDAEAETSIDLVANEGDDRARTLTTDWLLLLKRKNSVSASIRRHQQLTCRFEKRRGKWMVVSMEPQSLFDAPRF